MDDEAKPAARARRKWKRWAVLAILAGGLFWLNGPGLRWLAPKAADHFLPKAGFRGSFALEGSLTGGLTVKDLKLESDKALALLTVGRLTLDYRLGSVIKGKLDGIEIDGLHADLKLGLEPDVVDEEEPPEDEKDPLDLEELVKTLRVVRSKVLLVEADLKNISLTATKDGKPVIALARTSILHKAGEPDVEVDIGEITDASGYKWPEQESSIVWNENEILVERVDPLPDLSVRQLVLRLPESGGPSAKMEIHAQNAVFELNASPGFSSVQFSLREGRLDSVSLAERFDVKLPASGELSSLSVNVVDLLPDPKAATGSVQLLLEKVAYEDWTVPELSLDAGLETARGTVAARGFSLGTEFSLDAEAAIDREAGNFNLGEASGHFNVAAVSELVAGLAERMDSINSEADVPQSVLDGNFTVSFSDNKPTSADADLLLEPTEKETASSLALKAAWQPEKPLVAKVELDGLKLNADYDLDNTQYKGQLEFTEFKTGRIDRWLDIVKAGTKDALTISGHWSGAGSVENKTHNGSLTVSTADVAIEKIPPIHALGEIQYDWPKGFSTKALKVESDGQAVEVDLELADGFLGMTDLRWLDDDKEMVSGSAKLPVPEDFSKWKEMLANDSRPLALSVKSEVIVLESLKKWIPAAEQIDIGSTGQVDLNVSGTYAEPVVDLVLDAKNLQTPEQPELPSADLNVTLAGSAGHLSIDGSVTTKDFGPAVMTASMPFRPAEWAENPDLITEEKISARVDLPRIDLSRFAAMVPGTEMLIGSVTGNVEVAGVIGKPEIRGKLDLTNAALEMTRTDVPPISDLNLSIDFTPELVTLKSINAQVAGGSLQGGGTLALVDGKPGEVDIKLIGKQLPLKRDNSLIVRANANLRLAGPWEEAALTGSVAVVNSLFFQDIELLPIGSPFTGPSAAALPRIDAPKAPADSLPEPFGNWKLDVLTGTENPFLIRGNLASGEVTAKIRVGGTIGNPSPVGDVFIKDVKAALPFCSLHIPKGKISFTAASGLDPIIEIRGNAEPRPYRVNLFVHGRASDPQMVLTSSPPLPENEIMTLLATGTTTSGLEDPQAASSRAMQLLLEEVRRGRFAVGKQLRPVLKLLDRVDFSVAEEDPYSSTSYSTATLKISDRWLLSAGLGGEGDSRVLGIWRMRFY